MKKFAHLDPEVLGQPQFQLYLLISILLLNSDALSLLLEGVVTRQEAKLFLR